MIKYPFKTYIFQKEKKKDFDMNQEDKPWHCI